MDWIRREFLKLAGIVTLVAPAMLSRGARSAIAPLPGAGTGIVFDVRSFGAVGDGKTIDSPAINRAIEAAGAKGGTVYVPAGTYACYSLRLASAVALYVDQGATILAADTPRDGTASGYDSAESNAPWEAFQDFGHNHWHNSLIWGENIHDVAVLGPGLIWGRGLARGHDDLDLPIEEAPGVGNKAIALKNCRNVILRDLSMLACGHFAILATGVDNLTIDNLKIDTNRDGINIDACRNVRISNCTVNSPFDDGICPKSSFALGYARATENVTITNCQVSGYDEGTLLDGTYKRDYRTSNGTFSPTGRIKFGTESNGGFKNITVSNCVFDYSRGLALEAVDGALLEDVTISNITMRDISNSPIFMRLGFRGRGPKDKTTVGALRRIIISNVVVYNADSKYSAIISGIPGHPIEDVTLSNIRIYSQGGGTKDQAALEPPEKEDTYPEPTMFGELPAYGFFIRHVKGLRMNDVQVSYLKDDARPAFVMNDVKRAEFYFIRAQHGANVPTFTLKDIEEFSIQFSHPLSDK